ncbi:MAG: acetylxylan esterase [Planctomycetota bacterium]
MTLPRRGFATLFFLVVAFSSAIGLGQEAPSVARTDDSKFIDLNGHFPFAVPETEEEWSRRRAKLKQRVLVATGLYPLPNRTPLRAVIHGKVQRKGFSMERVSFQSLPGHHVSGMLFRPSSDNLFGLRDGKRPGVLSPHGHGGRTMRLSDEEIARELESGGERFEKSGRYPKLARCAHLARMGCVVLIFDMLGYGDSQQIPHAVAHRHHDAREAEANRDRPCFYSIAADLNAQSIMGLQTWNAIRALDFLESLPDVDQERLGVTGGSGGGTQTILLGAIDDRVKVSFPNGMVSTSMQGGCFCENCNYLRIGTGNVELAALFAPRPQGMTAADDWTRAMLTDGFPELQKLYGMLGEPHNVMCGDVLKYPHNYNAVTRAMMYPWMAKHLGLLDDLPDGVPLEESDFELFSESEMFVWNEQFPAPKNTGVPHEQSILRWWTQQNEEAIQGWIPDASADAKQQRVQWQSFQSNMSAAWSVIFDRTLPKRTDVKIETVVSAEENDGVRIDRVWHASWETEVLVRVIEPSGKATGTDTPAKTCIFVTQPKEALKSDPGNTWMIAKPLFGTDAVTLVVPQLLEAESVTVEEDGTVVGKQRLLDDPRPYSGFTFGYNRPLVVKRSEQILCVIAAYANEDESGVQLAAEGGGLVASAAGAAFIAGPVVEDFVVYLDGFEFDAIEEVDDQYFLPGSVKYLGLPGLLALRAPYPLGVMDESKGDTALLKQIYKAAGVPEKLQMPVKLHLE